LGIDAEYQNWIGTSAVAKTPMAIVEKTRDLMKRAVEDKSFINLIESQGDELRFISGVELAK